MIVGGTRAPVRLVAATGIVGAAVGAHLGAGGALPSPLLLAGLVLGIALVTPLLPARARSPRVSLALAVLLQPALHGLFDRMPAAGAASTGGAGMAAAHVAAAGFGAWWVSSGAARAVRACSGLTARLLPRHRALVPAPMRARAVRTAVPRPAQHVLLSAMSLRGPPAEAHPLPVV